MGEQLLYPCYSEDMLTQRTEPLTDELIADLAREAGQAGDHAVVALCDGAVWDFDAIKRSDVATIINDARAMDDSQPFVMVVSYQGLKT